MNTSRSSDNGSMVFPLALILVALSLTGCVGHTTMVSPKPMSEQQQDTIDCQVLSIQATSKPYVLETARAVERESLRRMCLESRGWTVRP